MRYFLKLIFHIACSFPVFSIAQPGLEFGKVYKDIPINRSSNLFYKINLSKGSVYQFSILQQGIAVYFELTDSNNTFLFKSKRPEDITGYLKREYAPVNSGTFTLHLKRFNDPENTDSGNINIFIRSLGKAEIATRNLIKQELGPENSKTVQTVDIDHFWEAFDHLKNCHTFSDSAATFQKYYLDKATDGLLEFIEVRDFTAEKFVQSVSAYPLFYTSIRRNTYEVKKAVPVIEEVFAKFKSVYANFKPFKVCFAIGIINTGGTVSNNFVLVGAEMATSTQGVDVSEFIKLNKTNKATLLSANDNIIQKIKNIVAHECVHTQQKSSADTAVIKCQLLYKAIKEGACDFIGEMVANGQINQIAHAYGDKNEKQIWTEFKNELCNENIGNWLYNGDNSKGKPADLGYYIGYKISAEYFKNAANKRQAIIDIIEMTDPIRFLQLSKYDQKGR